MEFRADTGNVYHKKLILDSNWNHIASAGLLKTCFAALETETNDDSVKIDLYKDFYLP